jgi:superoxide dismutase, Fe-Mn family
MNPHDSITRRDLLKTLGASAALLGLGATAASASSGASPAFSLPKLDYGYDALEPHIDAKTMEIHHSRHHQSYITNAVNALAAHSDLQRKSPEEMLRNLNALPESVRTTLRNNVGGHVNHAFFWKVIGPRAGGTPRGALGDGIARTFGSLDAFKAQFADAAMKRFGSGWAWLVVKDGKLSVMSTANQDSPLSEGARPVLGIDVWEHAYYLKYQNRRADYVAAFWNVVNWQQANANFAAA